MTLDEIIAKVDSGNVAGIIAEQDLVAELRRLQARLDSAEKCARRFWSEQDRDCKCHKCTAWESHAAIYGVKR